MKVNLLSCVRLVATPWTAAYQAPPSMGFSRQEYWSAVPLPSPIELLRCLIFFIKFYAIISSHIFSFPLSLSFLPANVYIGTLDVVPHVFKTVGKETF